MQTAIIAIDRDTDPNDLKRLALVFDRMVVALPEDCRLKAGSEEKLLRDPNGPSKAKLSAFNYFEDTERIFAMPVQALPKPLSTVLQDFIDAEIVSVDYQDAALNTHAPELADVRNLLMATSIADPEFCKISGTNPSEFGHLLVRRIENIAVYRKLEEGDPDDLPGTRTTKTTNAEQIRIVTQKSTGVRRSPNQEGNLIEEYLVREPQVVRDSYSVVSTLLLADAMNAQPVFLDQRHRKHLKRRYELLQNAETQEMVAAAGSFSWNRARA